ncbi:MULTISPECIES: sarcosine oxidase subunit delta [unclassified Mesorhizobium]|uniref:sarcosine oxidase subunit delta n=2 Tax=unclassified Mesorhizobium TaxID=325217 RepID=UPI00112B56AA|nr:MULTISPECIES: sarcosine oxidase subunit delta [unclassified Mesorhizobium]MCA0011955.1 sarcosine oxidase subunit delta [Mesorhizobium sp. B294B1A1]MCA0038209.1 sarcosine oxidase subunit delta [Mesorhizobium sp. B292B1B]MBZ9856415.1 sarcosine oxidase subunit delta [Mesorhizobium sp. CA13]MBZ9894508.1 sarcosine oxidase subunit delta [Mesorhizobium sp. BR1-1-6]MBZ9920496.1 sarcosine oxidase subunit delta [Mesorhizobium sp. BR1-1-7]
MKQLDCPMNGLRNIDEFRSFGPVRQTLDADATADADWAKHLFRADNRKGVVTEWWRHVPSNFFFLAERDVVTNEIIRTYAPGEGNQA